MAELFAGIGALFTGGAGGSGIITTLAPAAAGASGGGFSLAGILQGVATVAGIAGTLAAGRADAQAHEQAARDADMETAVETLQGIDRRRSIKGALIDAVGAQDVAYAASGADVSFGTAAQAREDAFREADFASSSATNTELQRTSRLAERGANYRLAARRARSGAVWQALAQGGTALAQIKGRY